MTTTSSLIVAALLALAATGTAHAQADNMSFFITSEGPGDGANLGGLDGADAHCQALAAAAGVSESKIWRAYLSASGSESVDARERIGDGPWYNYNGVMVAEDVDDLHSDTNALNKENSLSEAGETINGRGDSPNMHDVLTGSTLDGRAFGDGEDHTCSNWTSNAGDGSAQVGHHDRTGGGDNPSSWNSAHGSRGCGQADLQGTGGNGLYYCFAID